MIRLGLLLFVAIGVELFGLTDSAAMLGNEQQRPPIAFMGSAGSLESRCDFVTRANFVFDSTLTTPWRQSICSPRSGAILHMAAKKKKAKGPASNTSGFGGAAVASCPCGSGLGYMKCCGRLHRDNSVYQQASASEVVRARYSAFAKREADFLIRSTNPDQKDYMADKEEWKRNILLNCYDDYELPKCDILSEAYSEEGDKPVATVRFSATMIQIKSRERTSFVETSTFERATSSSGEVEGAWLYKDGILDTSPEV